LNEPVPSLVAAHIIDATQKIIGLPVVGSLFVSAPVTAVFEDFVYASKIKRLNDPPIRSRIFGGLLVFAGIIAQLVSAIADFLRSPMS